MAERGSFLLRSAPCGHTGAMRFQSCFCQVVAFCLSSRTFGYRTNTRSVDPGSAIRPKRFIGHGYVGHSMDSKSHSGIRRIQFNRFPGGTGNFQLRPGTILQYAVGPQTIMASALTRVSGNVQFYDQASLERLRSRAGAPRDYLLILPDSVEFVSKVEFKVRLAAFRREK